MITYYEPLVYRVPPEDDGILLRTVLHNRLLLSRKLVSRLKQTEQGITVNGSRQYTTVRVHAGDFIEVRMEEEQSDDIVPQPLPLRIVYEDEHLLVVDKEAGMIVHPTHGHYINTLANAVVHHWQEMGIRCRFRPVHRLDQETSGALAIAKTPFVHQQISEQMQHGEVMKQYLAIVHGEVAEEEGTISGPIDRNPEAPHIRIVTPGGYPAVTHYKVERILPDATLVRLQLETGRTHQIRVHMRSIGHPLLGDKMYGPEFDDRGNLLFAAGDGENAGEPEDIELERSGVLIGRHALHACRLAFTHPVTGRQMDFQVELPADMRQFLTALTD